MDDVLIEMCNFGISMRTSSAESMLTVTGIHVERNDDLSNQFRWCGSCPFIVSSLSGDLGGNTNYALSRETESISPEDEDFLAPSADDYLLINSIFFLSLSSIFRYVLRSHAAKLAVSLPSTSVRCTLYSRASPLFIRAKER